MHFLSMLKFCNMEKNVQYIIREFPSTSYYTHATYIALQPC